MALCGSFYGIVLVIEIVFISFLLDGLAPLGFLSALGCGVFSDAAAEANPRHQGLLAEGSPVRNFGG